MLQTVVHDIRFACTHACQSLDVQPRVSSTYAHACFSKIPKQLHSARQRTPYVQHPAMRRFKARPNTCIFRASPQVRQRRTLTVQAGFSNLAQEGWPLWATLAACAAGGQVLEQHTKVGAALSAPLLSLLLALVLSASGIIPVTSSTYDIIWTYLMPLGAALYLLESDLRQLVSAASTTLAAFIIGAIGSVAGTIVAWLLLGQRLGPDGWKVASALCASYIGGSVNFAAVSQSLGLTPGPLLAATMAADNIAMAVYLTVIMIIPAKTVVSEQPQPITAQQLTAVHQQLHAQTTDPPEAALASLAEPKPKDVSPTAESLALAIAFGLAACGLGEGLSSAVGLPSINLAVMAIMASLFASAGSSFCTCMGSTVTNPFRGAEALGGALMLLFFATIGAGAGSLSALKGTGWLTAFITVQLGVHMGVILLGGVVIAKLPMQVVLTASNANIGGPATAAAMAASRGWPSMIRPAMLTGSLGYAVGTAIGCGVSQWLLIL